MKILVPVKEVAEVDDEFRISGLDVDDASLEYDLNEWDDYAVEEAVQISEANDDVEVVTVTIGPERAEETARSAPFASAIRTVSSARSGPMVTVTTSTSSFASEICTASSTA